MVTRTGTPLGDLLTGTDASDTLLGLGGNDVLVGGKGADRLEGGAGSDTADYSGSAQGVLIELDTGLANSGDAAGDTLIGIENVNGTGFLDRIIGDANSNIIEGNGSTDALFGGDGPDRLFGGADNDQLEGGKGADLLDGGAGVDTVFYDEATSAVGVDLNVGGGFLGDALGDTYVGIENVFGSDFADLIFTDAANNVLNGGAGNDALIAGFGNDSVFGGSGDDTIEGGAGADRLDGGTGFDTALYQGAPWGIGVDLSTGTGFLGDAAGDVLSGIEHVTGTDWNDTIIGSTANNHLVGGGGDNSIAGGAGNDRIEGGTGNDHLDAGAGIDTVDYSGSQSGVNVDFRDHEVFSGDAQGDTLTGFENILGSAFADGLIGDNGANALFGGAGNDFLFGGQGRDQLTGGAGAERFFFQNTGDSGKTAATRDIIHDFHHAEHDELDLGQIDGSTSRAGKQDLAFIGQRAFTAEDQVRFFFEGNHTVVEVNTTGHAGAEMQFQLDGHINLIAGDFLLLTEG